MPTYSDILETLLTSESCNWCDNLTKDFGIRECKILVTQDQPGRCPSTFIAKKLQVWREDGVIGVAI